MVALFVLGTIVLFLAIDGVVLLLRRRQSSSIVEVPQPAVSIAGPHRVPGGVFLHPGHAWVSVDPQGLVRVGLDELAYRLLGPVDTVRFPAAGRKIARGETLFTVQVGESSVPITSPITGTLRMTQVPLDPSKGGDPGAWFCTIDPERLGEEIRPLRLAEDAAAWLSREFTRLRGMLHGLRLSPAMATLPDGGEPAEGLLLLLDEGERETLVQSFFAHDDERTH